MKVAEARASSNPVISTIAKYSFPFVKIPSNLLKASVEYSPAGLATIPGAGDKITQLSKAMLGTAVGIGTAALVGSDRMTWAEPADPTKKALFRAAGMQPYSVKIGDSWYSYSKMHPAISFNMALVAAIRDSEKNQLLNSSQVDTALEGAAKWVNFYADQSYVKNIGDMVSATKGDAEAITRGLSNYPQQLVPFRALLGWVAKIIDPYQRKVDTDGSFLTKQIQQLMTQIPGLSQYVPARLGPNDVPIENTNRLWNAVSPVRATTEDPTNKAAYDAAVLKSKATRQKNADKKAAYVNSSDAPQNILDTVGTYGKSVITDPGQTINAVLAGNPIRKVAGGAVILERKQGLGAMDKGNKATQVDHIIALTLGGTNSKDNLQVLTNQENMIKGQIETRLYKLMKSGEITKEEAQRRDLNWRNEVAILPKNIQEQLVTDLSTPEVKKTKQSTLKVKTPKAAKGPAKPKAGKRITVKVGKVPKIKTIKIKRFTPKVIKSKPLKLKKFTVKLSK